MATTQLNEAQLELLKLFSRKLTEQDVRELKQQLVVFLNEKAQQEADRLWDEGKVTGQKLDELLKSHPKRTRKS